SKVTFYRYFKGKDELILHIMTLLMEDAIQRTNAVLDGDLSLKQKFDQVIVMKQELMSAIGEEIIQGLFSYPALHEYYLSLVQESYKQLRDFLLLEQEQGRINQGLNIDIFMVVIREIAAFLSRESLNRSGSKFKELVAQVNEILVYGIFSRELK
ncbi:MAG TPA: TetR/AcrR family transcriptional regulator, partial [Candidatus Cloacimonadota bacterium]|nr:TetR/AcrR family transcriptional regulator [Candidatus Cloacimonadota bacterium]